MYNLYTILNQAKRIGSEKNGEKKKVLDCAKSKKKT